MKKIKICPKCGSIDITIPPSGMDFRMSMPDYCKKCRNRGIFPEVDIKKIKEFRKNIKK